MSAEQCSIFFAMKAGSQLLRYLERVTGRPVALGAMDASRLKGLPGFLVLGHAFREWSWLGQKLVLIEAATEEIDPSPGRLLANVKLLANHFECPVVFVFPAIDAYRRDRLLQLGVPFIVPGRQFFIPPFVCLAERFQRVERPKRFSTPAQVVVLYQLLRRPPDGSLLTLWAGWIGYSSMTLSKVRDELAAFGLCAVEPGDKPRGLRFLRQGRMLWDAARPALNSPVRRVCWANMPDSEPGLLRAGLTALSGETMMGDDTLPTYACRDAEWQRRVRSHRVRSLDHPDEATARIECWRYAPAILGGDGAVDRLSLNLSLAEDPDERIRLAADSLLEKMTW